MSGVQPTNLGEQEKLLLMAAYFHGTKPGAEICANCARVRRQALLWAGLWNEQMAHDERHSLENPVLEEWYFKLIALTRQVPESELLIEGAGNLGSPVDPPAWPFYTGCGLTSKGRELAERLFVEYPQYRASFARR